MMKRIIRVKTFSQHKNVRCHFVYLCSIMRENVRYELIIIISHIWGG